MAIKPLPPAFIERVVKTAHRVPFFTTRHLTELSLHDAPKPDDLQEPRLWASARARSVRAALQIPLAEGSLGTVLVNLGKLFLVEGPFYRSTPSEPEMDVESIERHLAARPDDMNLRDVSNIYYGLSRNPAAEGNRERLRQFFFRLSFAENKALAQATSIYLHLLRTEPTVAKTYRFHPSLPADDVRVDDVLAEYSDRFVRHWIPDGMEALSAVTIERGSVPVRVLCFVRPIPAEALLRIKHRFDAAGQAFELW